MARDRVRPRRGEIVLASAQGRSATDAAGMFAATAQYAREVIHAFNDQGFAALDPKWSGADRVGSAPTLMSGRGAMRDREGRCPHLTDTAPSPARRPDRTCGTSRPRVLWDWHPRR